MYKIYNKILTIAYCTIKYEVKECSKAVCNKGQMSICETFSEVILSAQMSKRLQVDQLVHCL